MKILITGTNGFIGRNIKELLQEKYESIHFPKRQELNLLEKNSVKDYLKKNKFDIIIHCGVSLTSVQDNLDMYFNIENCSKNFGKLICLGSGAEFDPKHYIPNMKENYFGKYIPVKSDIYSFSKYQIAKDIERKKRNIYNLRGFGIFGKYEDYRRRFISNNICRLLCGLNISIGKNAYFDYMYINDYVKMIEIFMNKNPKERTYNVCTGKTVDLLTLAKIIREVDGRNKLIELKEEGVKPEYSGDNSLFVNEFSDIDFTPHKKAIEELYQWYKISSKLKFDENLFNSWIKN
tara:strand:- start:488 stop:1360 length:873 start_codon:yes stop_codon:yes gene_type:complete